MEFNEIKGDLLSLAKQGKFDVIAHGANCMSTMGAGIAVGFKQEFGCDRFEMELIGPTIEKLGDIDYETVYLEDDKWVKYPDENGEWVTHKLIVVNAYTQYYYGRMYGMPLDYEALTLCMRKMNIVFKGKHIGLPQIGAGLAGGKWYIIEDIIRKELKDCRVTIVIYDK